MNLVTCYIKMIYEILSFGTKDAVVEAMFRRALFIERK